MGASILSCQPLNMRCSGERHALRALAALTWLQAVRSAKTIAVGQTREMTRLRVQAVRVQAVGLSGARRPWPRYRNCQVQRYVAIFNFNMHGFGILRRH